MTSRPEDHRDTPCAGGVPGALALIGSQVVAMGETLWAARGRGELMETVAQIESLKSSLDALELGVVREIDATNAVKDAGWASTQDFVTAVTGGHKGTGPAVVRLAKALDGPVLAPVAEALRDGWLCTAKAQVIERAIGALPGDQGLRARGVQALLAEAKTLDATDLKKLARRLLSVVDPTGDQRRDEQALDRLERAAHLTRHLAITEDQAGGAWIKGRCSAEDAALIKSTLIPLAKPQPNTGPICDPDTCGAPGCSHDGRDPRDHGTRMLDALVEACRLLQDTEVLPESHGAVPRLTLIMDLADLREQSGFGVTETGQDLSASTVRRLCCDAQVIPAVLGGACEVLDVGRAQRLVTAPIWKALVARDRHCRFPGCTRPPIMCHAHHIRHWVDGGPTCLDNMIILCGHHHRLIHAGPWQIRRTG
ncbi:MAG TPA: DUF222 domain-containing protein, partial [Nocardioidaceae bacterium]|nr:DUF222 domain-containing protein [Nocardioidaceae bacterium]